MSDWDLRSASAQTPQQRQSSNTGAGSGDPILEDRMMTVDGDLAMDEEDVEEIDLRDEHDDDDAAADPAAAAASSASSPSKAHPPLNKTTSGGVSSRLAAFMRKAQTPAAVVVVPASPSAAPTALASAPGVADAHGSIPPSPMASQPGSPQPTSSAMFTNLKSVFHRRTPSGASTTSAAVAAGLASGHAGTEKGAVAMSALPEDMLIPAEVASLGSTGPPSATVSYGGSDFDRTSFTHVSGEGSSLPPRLSQRAVKGYKRYTVDAYVRFFL
ncbi:hypothetical protein CAOG_000492 [Capsaspora owczarzaki ATCC 30864]|uniref:Uncharacterized protein n=1 Tax=Capsaspora owczarzaki (strain ATCC 30864) TaxID=595528 RepID=A0A0D2U115_CAPO3|nr:hypothetical protein CAOG_000492 [Capsaspora owczarzaki ATCC 30864]